MGGCFMLDESLVKSLDSYILRHYISTGVNERVNIHYSISVDGYQQLDEAIQEEQQSLADYIREWLIKKGREDIDVYKEAGLDRRVFSKIRNEKSYHPGKNTTIAIALALHLSREEAGEFLSFIGYSLNKMQKEDVVIRFCFDNQIYDVMVVNELLAHYGLPLLVK